VHAQGPLQVSFNAGGDQVHAQLGAWDTLSMPGGCTRQFINTGAQEAQALLVVKGDTYKTPRFAAEVHAAALALDITLDAGGRLARHSLLPPAMTV